MLYFFIKKSEHEGMTTSQLKRLKELEIENARLKESLNLRIP
jgi:hypothetical protein